MSAQPRDDDFPQEVLDIGAVEDAYWCEDNRYKQWRVVRAKSNFESIGLEDAEAVEVWRGYLGYVRVTWRDWTSGCKCRFTTDTRVEVHMQNNWNSVFPLLTETALAEVPKYVPLVVEDETRRTRWHFGLFRLVQLTDAEDNDKWLVLNMERVPEGKYLGVEDERVTIPTAPNPSAPKLCEAPRPLETTRGSEPPPPKRFKPRPLGPSSELLFGTGSAILERHVQLVDSAKTSIRGSIYVCDNVLFQRALQRAAGRGVSVRLLLDKCVLQWRGGLPAWAKDFECRLVELGGGTEPVGKLHAKVWIVDADGPAPMHCIGSFNPTFVAAASNVEAMDFVVDNPQKTKRLAELYDRFWESLDEVA